VQTLQTSNTIGVFQWTSESSNDSLIFSFGIWQTGQGENLCEFFKRMMRC